ncbi:hypothetical protein [Colwellia sp. 12G3]|uniref:hypothetical protein n=1 Tax=Colwellia sp. 12G3 TaxID=2058299 RepID=UPI000C33CBB1|nr:hypothetical protein [Colwellia sp. 12G3]PKI15876.1 hypothetical protein CXF71_12805 [Colwellia sp. 12G3]
MFRITQVLLVPTLINKTMMVLLLSLIFIGQSMASISMFYSMTSKQSMAVMSSMKGSHHMMEETDGSTHDMSTMSECDEETMTTSCSTMASEDCCAQECDCLTTGCSTVSAFSTIINFTPVFAIESKINTPIALAASQTLISLYRPPILS